MHRTVPGRMEGLMIDVFWLLIGATALLGAFIGYRIFRKR
jgi:hypothetical protein